MKALGNLALLVGIISLAGGVILRTTPKIIAPLGLVPSSFLEFSAVCFLMTIALDTISKK